MKMLQAGPKLRRQAIERTIAEIEDVAGTWGYETAGQIRHEIGGVPAGENKPSVRSLTEEAINRLEVLVNEST